MKPEEIETPVVNQAEFQPECRNCGSITRNGKTLWDVVESDVAKELECRAIIAERLLRDLLSANAAPSITGFTQACERAREFLNSQPK